MEIWPVVVVTITGMREEPAFGVWSLELSSANCRCNIPSYDYCSCQHENCILPAPLWGNDCARYCFYNRRQNCWHIDLLTPYFVTVIPFCPASLSFQLPSPRNNVVWQFLWSWGTNKQHWMGERGLFDTLLRDKKSGVIWCTKSTVER